MEKDEKKIGIVKIDIELVALDEKEHKELAEQSFKAFDDLKKEGVIHGMECPTFMMAWSLACLHFDKKIGDRLKRFSKVEKT